MPGHALDADGERDGDGRRQPFGNEADRQRHHADQSFDPGQFADEDCKQEQPDRDGGSHDGDRTREPVDLGQKRGRQFFDVSDHARDMADLGLRSGCGHHAETAAACDQRSRMGHRMSFAKRRIGGHRFDALRCRDRLAGQRRFIDRQALRFQQSEIGRHPVPCFQHHDVARHQRFGRNIGRLAAASDPGRRRHHLPDCIERLLGAPFLEKTDQCIDHDDGGDHSGIDHLAEHRCNGGAGDQEPDQGRLKLPAEPAQRAGPRRGRQPVRPILTQPLLGLGGGKTLRPASKPGQRLVDGNCCQRQAGCRIGAHWPCILESGGPACLMIVAPAQRR
jgi:hypothetical protein